MYTDQQIIVKNFRQKRQSERAPEKVSDIEGTCLYYPNGPKSKDLKKE